MQKDFNQSLIALLQPHFAHPPEFQTTAHVGDLMCTNIFIDAYIDDLFIQKYAESDEREARQAAIKSATSTNLGSQRVGSNATECGKRVVSSYKGKSENRHGENRVLMASAQSQGRSS